jgi:hypothetical protein
LPAGNPISLIEAQALVDLVRPVEIRIVHQPLPADGGARLLEVHAHDDNQVLPELVLHLEQAPRVLEPRFGIVNRARPDDDDHPVVRSVEDAVNRLARVVG